MVFMKNVFLWICSDTQSTKVIWSNVVNQEILDIVCVPKSIRKAGGIVHENEVFIMVRE